MSDDDPPAARAKGTIAYRAHVVAPRALGIVAALFVAGLALASCLHATKLTCTGGDGTCVVSSYAVLLRGERRVEVPLREIVELHAATGRNQKGFTYAVVSFHTRRGDVDLSGGSIDGGKFSIESARDAVVAFEDFRARGRPTLDVWLVASPLSTAFVSAFALAFLGAAGLVTRRLLRAWAPVRIVVDHEAGLVIVPAARSEIPIKNIVGVELDEGPPGGWRVTFVMSSGHRAPATDEHRPQRAHQARAVEELRAALGVGDGEAKAETKKTRKRRP